MSQESLASLDIDAKLSEIEKKEKEGAVFSDILHDFMEVARAVEKSAFGFVPDTMIQTPQEFTDALFHYANENNLNLIITKEGMYPEFTINGVEYTAHREFSRFGAVIRCRAIHPEELEPANVSTSARKVYKVLWKAIIPAFIFLFILLNWFPPESGIGGRIIVAAFFTAILVILFGFVFPRAQ